MNDRQAELFLPPVSTDDALRDRLAGLVEESNATVGEERAAIHREIVRVRALVAKGGEVR